MQVEAPVHPDLHPWTDVSRVLSAIMGSVEPAPPLQTAIPLGPLRPETLFTFLRVGGLAALLWGVASTRAPGVHGADPAVGILAALSGLGWTGWMASRWRSAPTPVVGGFLALLMAAGGALVPYTGVATGLLAVGAIGAGIALPLRTAARLAGVGVAALLLSTSLAHGGSGNVIEGVCGAVAGLMAGDSRRRYVLRAVQAEQLLEERVRADAERDRATALAERNRVGREIHDVLAHALGALTVQLEAADALLETGQDTETARRLVRQARQLAVQGLDETRQAVHALRDEPVALAEQLASLAARDGVILSVTGDARPLDAEAGLALYRTAQEALTNARKHAPGAPVTLDLDFRASSVVLEVTNGAPVGPGQQQADHVQLDRTGGGFGLRGMRERVEHLGGQMEAQPVDAGWRVHVAVPR